MSVLLAVEGVRKSYWRGPHETVVLANVSLEVRAGEFFGGVGAARGGQDDAGDDRRGYRGAGTGACAVRGRRSGGSAAEGICRRGSAGCAGVGR